MDSWQFWDCRHLWELVLEETLQLALLMLHGAQPHVQLGGTSLTQVICNYHISGQRQVQPHLLPAYQI